jgi:hypothetical protein
MDSILHVSDVSKKGGGIESKFCLMDINAVQIAKRLNLSKTFLP